MSINPQIYSVSEITAYIKHFFERDTRLQAVQIKGEVSNLKYHSSGHVYFSIKDAGAQLSCVMFRTYAQAAPRMQEGDKVVLFGSMTVYPPRGNYQLMVRAVKKETGKGDLYQQFLALKEKLSKEGLFDPKHKRAIPAFPSRISVLTSPSSAAIKDIIRTIKRRYDLVELLIIPTIVQGAEGTKSIIHSLQLASETGADTIILGRGGGSIEDLWNFNEEAVARAIAASPIPIITGIGHETDFTIADFVADVRASTPTAAAERSVPDKHTIIQALNEYENQLRRGLQYFIDFKRQVLDDYNYRLEQAVLKSIRDKRHDLALLATRLKGMNIKDRLKEGYTLVLKNGKIQQNSSEIKVGDEIEAIFTDGRLAAKVESIRDL